MKKRFSLLGLVASIIITALVSSVITLSVIGVSLRDSYNKRLSDIAGSTFVQKVNYIQQLIDDKFIKEYDMSAAEDDAIAALLEALGDPYTFYMTADEMSDYLYDTGGTLVGIGVHVVADSETGGIYLTRIMPSSPAGEAGLKAGDIIVAVEGTRITKENYSECVDMIRGEEGTMVGLTVLRGKNEFDITVKRAKVENETVYLTVRNGNIAHITITEFIGGTSKQFISCMDKAKEQGCTSYIFDVRNNPGGNLNEILEVLDYLLPEGDLINIVYADGTTTTYTSKPSCVEADMVVLCNGNTASAGELFTAALRDYGVADIVGETTYGKGTMQTVIKLGDGSGVRISVAYYNPPCNISYDGKGIEPDVRVSLPEEAYKHFYQMTYEEDTQLQKAVEILLK